MAVFVAVAAVAFAVAVTEVAAVAIVAVLRAKVVAVGNAAIASCIFRRSNYSRNCFFQTFLLNIIILI